MHPVVPTHEPQATRLGLLLTLLLGLLLWLPPTAHAAPAAGTRPNFVVILMDDLGVMDLGCYGSQFHQTPHLDRMAREGMQFTQAYAACPVCSPTRAALLAGQAPARLHITDWLPGRPDRKDQKMRRAALATHLPSALVTLAEALKSAGYATAHVGKWHVGGAGNGPKEHGFDLNIGGDHRGTPASYFAPYGRGERVIPGLEDAPPGEYLTDRLTDEAVKFIETRREQPFLLYLPHFAVHTPLTAKSNLVSRYRAQVRPGTTQSNAIYAAMVQSMDESVGRILAALESSGLAANTLVLFTSDNGGLSVAEGPNTPATSNAPLRAGKGHLHEGGIRVPLLARWPGVVPAGQSNATPVITTDLYFTLLELAGVPATPNQAADGLSLAALLRGGGSLTRTALHWHYPHYSNQGGKPGGAIREGDFKLIESYESGYLELYDLARDPGETNNLAGARPQLANDLAKKLAAWRRNVGARMMTPNPEYQPVPLRPDDTGRILLPAHEAIVHGSRLRYEPPANKNTLGYWTQPQDWASWDFAVTRPGRFTLEVLQGCGKGSGGSEVEIRIEGASPEQTVKFTVEDTGHFQNFITRELGQVNLAATGRHTLAVKPRTKPGVAVMDLRQILLRPVP